MGTRSSQAEIALLSRYVHTRCISPPGTRSRISGSLVTRGAVLTQPSASIVGCRPRDMRLLLGSLAILAGTALVGACKERPQHREAPEQPMLDVVSDSAGLLPCAEQPSGSTMEATDLAEAVYPA
jgi:hypothetical protein